MEKISKETWKKVLTVTMVGVIAWLFYLSRDVLTPFVLAAIFAYLLSPLVRVLESRGRLPKTAAILIVYLGIMAVLIFSGINFGSQIVAETKDFAAEARVFLTDPRAEKEALPGWLSPYSEEIVMSIHNSINISSQQVIRFFSGALSSLFNIFVFTIVLFYFLKDGEKLVAKIGFGTALSKVNRVLSNYFLAQLLLVAFMTGVCSLVFSLLGVKYALTLGIIVGLAELVPIVGPTIAFLATVLITTIGGGSSFLNMSPLYEPLIVGLIYVLINQAENILIVPQVTGRMVQLHPLVILASVLIGGQLFGVVGFLVAVPLVASIKVIFEHIKAP